MKRQHILDPVVAPAEPSAREATDAKLLQRIHALGVLHRGVMVEFKGDAVHAWALTMPERRWVWSSNEWVSA